VVDGWLIFHEVPNLISADKHDPDLAYRAAFPNTRGAFSSVTSW
jgi:hypothetical protein